MEPVEWGHGRAGVAVHSFAAWVGRPSTRTSSTDTVTGCCESTMRRGRSAAGRSWSSSPTSKGARR